MSVALFGLGRAGSIHLANLVSSPRARLAYVVELDEKKCEWARNKWNLGERTAFIQPKDADRVYKDSTLVGQ